MRPTFYKDWTVGFDRRLALRRDVMQALGIDLPRSVSDDVRETLRQTLIACATCDRIGSCAAWVKLGDPDLGPPAFCPNRARFKALKSEAD